jgi:hemolysin D
MASQGLSVIKAEQRTGLQLLKAPVDGSVQQLAVHTFGGVVTRAQALLVVVSADSHLEIEADIGFVHVGQDAEVKVDTFNFTHYGLLHGRVLSVSKEATTRDEPQDRSDDKSLGAESSTSEPKGMQVKDSLVNLSP